MIGAPVGGSTPLVTAEFSPLGRVSLYFTQHWTQNIPGCGVYRDPPTILIVFPLLALRA